jgi:iron complex outermembrane receptor protein
LVFRQTRGSAAALLATAAIAVGTPGLARGQEAAIETEETKAERRGRLSSSDIVVIGRSLDTEKTPLPVYVLAGDELAHRRQGGLGETLAGLPGIGLIKLQRYQLSK